MQSGKRILEIENLVELQVEAWRGVVSYSCEEEEFKKSIRVCIYGKKCR